MVPGKEIVQTARLVATARLADAQGDLAGAAKAYEEAVAIEDALAYMEPPYWYYPITPVAGLGVLAAAPVQARCGREGAARLAGCRARQRVGAGPA